MTVTGERYNVSYDPLDQQLNFEGIFRTYNNDDLKNIKDFFKELHNKVKGTLKLNFRKLRYINSAGIRTLLECLHYAKSQSKLKIKLIGSKVLTWEVKTLPRFSELWDQIEFVIHDENFYESQGIIEQDDFIPLLRTQTRLLWPLEKEILVKHGLKAGMKMADICCGCGDVALLIAKELKPSIVVGIDHSLPAIQHAAKLQKEFEVNNADFRLGDATALMLDDDLFDFVICRLSIQIFSKPEEILKELYRITKPGGTIYITGEDYDLIVGYPNARSIRQVYDKAGVYGDQMGMDLYNGKKLFSILAKLKLKDLKIDYIHVDTNNSSRNDFASMIKSWRYFSADTIGKKLNISQEDYDQLLKGYDDHIDTINNPLGYTIWTVAAGSGVKRK
jgi:ubiquinone/menaquinone biosynthesis C-methylase UbiE